MARNLSPRTKRMRRIGEKIFTHGEKAFSRRSYPPGQHGPKGSSRASEYGLRLREKQKAQMTYGILERQFRRYVESAKRQTGNTGALLLEALELRLDNVVFRAGLARSREAARQFVRHGHVVVNGKRVDIPSYHVRSGQQIGLHPRAQKKTGFQELQKQIENFEAPSWMTLDKQTLTATVLSSPTIDERLATINPQLIVEFYSR